MIINKKLIAFFIFFSILTLSILNIKNPEKTKFYLFTTKTENISLGNLITIAFISGLSFGSVLSLISKNNSQELVDDSLTNDEEMYKTDDNDVNQQLDSNRPPERDVRESQPTISVNYRFVDQNNNSYSSKKAKETINNRNNNDYDWENYDNEW
tara:strand:+ start:106 stop:567 length:462 start_codon:yes stop_codon:yes gene_type:complete